MAMSPYVKSLIRETGKDTEEVEQYWKKAKRITEDTFGIDEEKFTEREFEYSRDVVYRMLGLDESFSISEFIKSDMPAKEFIEQAVQTSGDFSVGDGGQTAKRKPYKDDPDEPEKVKEFETEEEEEERQYKQDGTGPHGQGAGPGQGKADGTGRKPSSKMSYEEEAIFSGKVISEEGEESLEEEDETYKEMLNDDALPE